jgi:hypothetical protein
MHNYLNNKAKYYNYCVKSINLFYKYNKLYK